MKNNLLNNFSLLLAASCSKVSSYRLFLFFLLSAPLCFASEDSPQNISNKQKLIPQERIALNESDFNLYEANIEEGNWKKKINKELKDKIKLITDFYNSEDVVRKKLDELLSKEYTISFDQVAIFKNKRVEIDTLAVETLPNGNFKEVSVPEEMKIKSEELRFLVEIAIVKTASKFHFQSFWKRGYWNKDYLASSTSTWNFYKYFYHECFDHKHFYGGFYFGPGSVGQYRLSYAPLVHQVLANIKDINGKSMQDIYPSQIEIMSVDKQIQNRKTLLDIWIRKEKPSRQFPSEIKKIILLKVVPGAILQVLNKQMRLAA